MKTIESTNRELADVRRALDQSAIVAITDKAGVIIHVNDKFCEISKYSREELLGKNHRIINSGYHPREFFVNLWQTISSGNTWVGEIKNRAKDGTYYWVYTTIVPSLNEQKKPHQYVSIRFDITERKDAEEKLKARETQIIIQDRLASIGLLASGLAHEIGTPLGIIRGRAEIISKQLKEESLKNSAGVIITQIDRISVLIKSLLSLARGGQSKGVAPVLLSQVVNGVLELLTHEISKNKIEIINKTQVIELTVLANSGELHQVVLNLLVNAIHAIQAAESENQKHSIEINVIDEGKSAVLSIRDSGCGISSENMKNIFKPFFTTKDVGVGTGLGLVTSYRIIEAWGGEITVKSTQGVGTTFQIILPKK